MRAARDSNQDSIRDATREETSHETSPISESGRPRPCRLGRRSASHRAIDAGGEMATDVELPEIARHALGRGRNHFQIRLRSDRQQVPDPALRRGRDRAGAASRRRRHRGHRRVLPHRGLLLVRQGPDLGAVLRGAVRPQRAPAERLVLRRRRHEADERVHQEVRTSSRSRRATPARRWAAGSGRRSRTSPT